MSKEITTDMLLDMIKNTGWDVNGVGVLKNIDAEATIMRQEKQIADLEAKLAEKDAEIEQWKSMAERSSSILDRFNYCGVLTHQHEDKGE